MVPTAAVLPTLKTLTVPVLISDVGDGGRNLRSDIVHVALARRAKRELLLVNHTHTVLMPIDRSACTFFCSGADRDALEVEFQSQLALPGPDGRIVDHAEVGIADISVRRAEYGMVEGILRLQAQFQLHRFVAVRECEFLQDGQVVSEE